MENETISVVFQPLGSIAGITYYHETLVYTHAIGQEEYATAYASNAAPNGNIISATAQATVAASTNVTSSPFGTLQVASGLVSELSDAQYVNMFGSDAAPYTIEAVATGSDLSCQWLAILNAENYIGADLAKAETQETEHGGDIAKAAQKRELRMLKAPVDGTVQQLAIHTIGGIVTPAQQLMVIVPKDAGLEIEANLANKDVGFVHKGQEVEVKIEAFTFTRYGLLHGTVTSLSQDVVAPQDANSPDGRGQNKNDIDEASNDQDRQSRQAAYVAHVALAETGINTEQGYTPLEPGMAITAEIKTGQRRVISYLLSPLLRYKQEGLRER